MSDDLLQMSIRAKEDVERAKVVDFSKVRFKDLCLRNRYVVVATDGGEEVVLPTRMAIRKVLAARFEKRFGRPLKKRYD